jgi:hypothetical protein
MKFLGTLDTDRDQGIIIPLPPFKTQCKMEVRILSGGVTKNLTLHGMSKIYFQPEFWNSQMLSFPKMYNTMGSKVDGLAVREHFLSKNARKSIR